MKKVTLQFLLLLGLLVMAVIGCREDVLLQEETEIIPTETDPDPTGNAVTYETDLIGRVVDPSGTPITGATVVVGDDQVLSDDFGFFEFSDVDAPSIGLYVKVTKPGYFTAGTHHFPTEAAAATIRITALPEQTFTFLANQGYQTTMDNGAQLSIPADAVGRAGVPYEGTVTIASTWLDPEADATLSTMPGALLGVDADGETQFLRTYGMMAVEMRDENGAELQLLEGQQAQLNFPLSSSLGERAPDMIPLWHFDETAGVWVEEGTALRTQDSYEAQVSHFSWWNCDDPFDVTLLCLNITSTDGDTLDNVKACFLDNGLTLCNAIGEHCGLVPAGTSLTIVIKDFCDNVLHMEDVGPIDGDLFDPTFVDIEITLPVYGLHTFEGQLLDCGSQVISSNGLVELTIGNQSYLDATLDNGAYSISFFNCASEDEEVTLTGYNLDELLTGNLSTNLMPNQEEYTVDVMACGEELDDFFLLNTLDDTVLIGNCEAIVSSAETLIRAVGSPFALLGIKGFEEGTFDANLISATASAFTRDISCTITEYGPVGGTIKGSFTSAEFTGTFSATRIR